MAKSSKNPSQIYYEMRNMAFNVSADQIQVKPTNELPSVYGVLMEIGMSETAVTLLSLADGTVSLYLESGGGVIGGGVHESVQKIARRFLQSAEQFKGMMTLVKDFSLPDVGKVKFYVLTYEGVLSIKVDERDLAEDRHRLSPLFFAGHEVIAQLREVDKNEFRA